MARTRATKTAAQKTARNPITPRYLSPQELATWLALPIRTLRYWREIGHGPRHVHFGRSVRYAIAEVEKFCEDPEAYQHERDERISL